MDLCKMRKERDKQGQISNREKKKLCFSLRKTPKHDAKEGF